MVSLGRLDPMPKLRDEAVQKASAWFNERARENLHDDLVALAAGRPGNITAREKHKQKVLERIQAITTPADLQVFMSDISKV